MLFCILSTMLSSTVFLNVIVIFVSVTEKSSISSSSFFIMFNTLSIASKFLIIPLPTIEILELSFFTILFIVFSSIISEITVPTFIIKC